MRILVIEDCPEEQQSLGDALRAAGHAVTAISEVEHAKATVDNWTRDYELVIIEETMHHHQGLRLVHEAHMRRASLPVVVVSRESDWAGYVEALSEGAAGYLSCPVRKSELLKMVAELQ